MNSLKLLKLGWRAGTTVLVVTTMVFGGLFLNLKSAFAEPAPNMTIRHEGLIGGAGNWSHSVTLNPGDEVQFYAEIHNTVVGSTAHNVTLKQNLTGGTFTDGTSVATVTSSNANSANDTVNIHINGGGKLEFIEHSTRVTWDVNGDGVKEFNNTHVAGNPLNGLEIGGQHGCNQFIIQVYWAARVVKTEQPSPSPSPTPGPTQEQHQEQTQNNNQNQTVNITNNNTPAVAGVSVPVKQPETGVSVLGLTSMAGAAPVGYLLSRFGRGRTTGKREETLEEIAMGIFRKRSGKNKDA